MCKSLNTGSILTAVDWSPFSVVVDEAISKQIINIKEFPLSEKKEGWPFEKFCVQKILINVQVMTYASSNGRQG